MGTERIKLVIESALENVPLVGLSVNNICRHANFSEAVSSQIDLCVVEAVTNCVKHAYNQMPGHKVEVDISLYDDRISFSISDHGEHMEIFQTPRLEFDPEDVEHLPEGGMGLYIIHQTMDEVSYKTEAGKNTLTLTKRF
jgi:serine/threonine-protein kinase RsbW